MTDPAPDAGTPPTSASPCAGPMPRAQAIATLTAPGQLYELAPIEVAGRALRHFVNAPPTLRALFESTASELPFLVFDDERLTFAQAWAQSSRIGHALAQRCGVRAGDRVAIAMRNFPEWVLAFSAITSIGAIAVAVNALWSAEELAYGLADCGATLLFADAERLERLRGQRLPRRLRLVAVRCAAPEEPAGATTLDALLAGLGEVAMPPAPMRPDDWATMFYTSGSSGHPKGVVSSHRAIVSALLSWELDRRIGELAAGIEPPPPAGQPGTLLAVPLFHVTGSHAVYLSSYRAQRRLVCTLRWDALAAARLIERERLTSFVAPAAMTGDLIRVARAGGFDLGSLQLVGGGGAPRAPEQVRQIGASFGQALPTTGWGMTETNAIGVSIGGEDYLARPASSGRCSQVLELKVVDEAGRALPTGQRGELLVRGTSLFAGYWKNGALDTSIFDDGWFRTGDVAQFDDEAFCFIVDRIKDMIIRGGENIGCAHVEAALLMHPQVHEAAVYALPDARLGEEVGATVYADRDIDLEALREFLARHLARFEIPSRIVVADAPLPRTPSGKILKRQIRQQALARPDAGPAGA